jgi:hypothetical protein
MQLQFDFDTGDMKDNNRKHDVKNPAEIRAVKNENRMRKATGLDKRTTYGGKKIKEID